MNLKTELEKRKIVLCVDVLGIGTIYHLNYSLFTPITFLDKKETEFFDIKFKIYAIKDIKL